MRASLLFLPGVVHSGWLSAGWQPVLSAAPVDVSKTCTTENQTASMRVFVTDRHTNSQ